MIGPAAHPPLGLKPRHIHDQQRLVEILEAMVRYVKELYSIPNEWREEAEELLHSFDEYLEKNIEKKGGTK